MISQKQFTLSSYGRGYHLVTHEIEKALGQLPLHGVLHLFIKHTSAALSLNENADPSVRHDLESIMNHIVPEGESYYTHVSEGPDDMPAHVKSSLIGVAVSIPITNGRLNLGTWQGIYLCEFRNTKQRRSIVATIIGAQ